MGRSAFRGLVYVWGGIATAAGLVTVFTGADSLIGQDLADATVENELRFYAAFYIAYGLVLLWVAPRADRETTVVRALAGALFLAGLARTIGWIAVGQPHGTQLALLAVELIAPPLIIGWQSRLAGGEP